MHRFCVDPHGFCVNLHSFCVSNCEATGARLLILLENYESAWFLKKTDRVQIKGHLVVRRPSGPCG